MNREGKYFERQLPEGYVKKREIDAKNTKIGVVLNLIALLPIIACLVGAYFIMGKPDLFAGSYATTGFTVLGFIAVMVSYIVLHELVHGAVYKLFTREKLTFGMTLTVAFCGVPHIYVYRRPALAAVLAPFAVFLPVFLTLCFVLPTPLMKFLAACMLGMHVGGCSGDLWVSGILLFRMRDNGMLMNDTGPKQTFYVRGASEDAEAE